MENKKLWLFLGAVLITTFSILGFFGREIYRQAPPIPEQVITAGGELLMTEATILDGQEVWQSIGGQELGTIWGHGAYQAPDWSADWLHREAIELRQLLSLQRYSKPFSDLDSEEQVIIAEKVKNEFRTNTYAADTGVVTVSLARAKAIETTRQHYLGLFGEDPQYAKLRDNYAIQDNAIPDPLKRAKFTNFIFWTAWAASTNRPNNTVTYSNNWPHEPLVGNTPTSGIMIWSIFSVALLVLGIGSLAWYNAFKRKDEEPDTAPHSDQLLSITMTPSMRAVGKYCVVVVLLLVLQIIVGIITAHYTVEGQHFYGFPLAKYFPYSLTRTWHVQLGLFWIATAFLAIGLFLAPAAGKKDPRFQLLGVNVLFGALLLVVGGSLFGEWLSIQQKMDLGVSFWFGHQGYQYLDLGRFWQIGLLVGLILWSVLVIRGLWPALTKKSSSRQLVLLFAGSVVAIGSFYAVGLFYGSRTHMSIVEYWRWWVVHLWVEGFFEVFTTAVIAFIFMRLGLITKQSATRATLFATGIYLLGGIPGTFHHLYFSGTPVSIMAIGATFSALEIVPLALIGIEAWSTWKLRKRTSWTAHYRWPIYCFVAVAFWNLVGAGFFGFLINPPLALYYMQGLNTTQVHAHTALFGVYGFLALGLLLIIFKHLNGGKAWNDAPLKIAFWSMNIGLALMVLLSVLPIGILQTIASIEYGLYFARSAEFMQQDAIVQLRWLRLIGDGIFTLGTLSFAWFVIGLKTGWSYALDDKTAPSVVKEQI